MHDGEDLYADVALACVEKAEQYDWSHPKIEGRVMQMARYLRARHHRHERLRRHASLPSDDCQVLACEDRELADAETDDHRRCNEAVARLPLRYRRVVQEHCTTGKKLVEIAIETKLPPATIRTHWRRVLQRLARDAGIRGLAVN